MARVKLNPMFEELHGRFGDIVFRELFGETIMARPPDMTGIVPTAAQLSIRERFSQAAIYGRMALDDPQTAALYKAVADEKRKPVFSLLVADFFNAPVMDELDVSQYAGQTGSPIYVRTHDDFSVQSVQIKITDTDGQTLESGMATVEAGGTGRWKYTGQTLIGEGVNVRIQVLVTDRPGNVTDKETSKSV